MRHVCQNFANGSNFVGARTAKAIKKQQQNQKTSWQRWKEQQRRCCGKAKIEQRGVVAGGGTAGADSHMQLAHCKIYENWFSSMESRKDNLMPNGRSVNGDTSFIDIFTWNVWVGEMLHGADQ